MLQDDARVPATMASTLLRQEYSQPCRLVKAMQACSALWLPGCGQGRRVEAWIQCCSTKQDDDSSPHLMMPTSLYDIKGCNRVCRCL